MSEKIPTNEAPPLAKGELVRIKDTLEPVLQESIEAVVRSGGMYRVVAYEEHDDSGGPVAWLGPVELEGAELDNFNIAEMEDAAYQERYKRIFPIAAGHLQRVSN